MYYRRLNDYFPQQEMKHPRQLGRQMKYSMMLKCLT